MSPAARFLMHQVGPVLFGVMFLEQIGLPLPSAPWLLAAGALSVGGGLSLSAALIVTVFACLTADLIWFYLGRYRGKQALQLLCRVSLEPNSCVRKTQAIFIRYGVAGIVVSKFLPGLGMLFPPLAGMSRISSTRFVLYDALGSLLYGGSFLLLGQVFSNQLEKIGSALTSFTTSALWVVAGLVVAYIGFKYLQQKHLAHRGPAARLGVSAELLSPGPLIEHRKT
jgi:membrane protein DedA with SNARE-associated domain